MEVVDKALLRLESESKSLDQCSRARLRSRSASEALNNLKREHEYQISDGDIKEMEGEK